VIIIDRAVVNLNTGELKKLHQDDRIIRKESIDYLKNTEVWDMKHFYKGNIEELKEINKTLNSSEKAFLFSIIPYISYKDCLLCYSNGKDIKQDDLIKITGLSRKTIYRTMETLRNKDIIYRGKNSKNNQYFVNPWLFVRGNTINTVLKTMFKNYKIYIKNKTKWKDLE